MFNRSSSTSPTNCGAFKSVQGSDAVESPLALGLRRYLARMSSVVSRMKKGLFQMQRYVIFGIKLDFNIVTIFVVYLTMMSVAPTIKQ
jgi:hypothetical protein